MLEYVRHRAVFTIVLPGSRELAVVLLKLNGSQCRVKLKEKLLFSLFHEIEFAPALLDVWCVAHLENPPYTHTHFRPLTSVGL